MSTVFDLMRRFSMVARKVGAADLAVYFVSMDRYHEEHHMNRLLVFRRAVAIGPSGCLVADRCVDEVVPYLVDFAAGCRGVIRRG